MRDREKAVCASIVRIISLGNDARDRDPRITGFCENFNSHFLSLTSAMALNLRDAKARALDVIVSNDSDSAQDILSELQLDGPPSPERIYKEIEEKILLPRSTLPDHWLPTYQM